MIRQFFTPWLLNLLSAFGWRANCPSVLSTRTNYFERKGLHTSSKRTTTKSKSSQLWEQTTRFQVSTHKRSYFWMLRYTCWIFILFTKYICQHLLPSIALFFSVASQQSFFLLPKVQTCLSRVLWQNLINKYSTIVLKRDINCHWRVLVRTGNRGWNVISHWATTLQKVSSQFMGVQTYVEKTILYFINSWKQLGLQIH